MRQRRRRQTSSPTITSASRIRPSVRKPIANSQCTISLGGSTVLLYVLDERARDNEREEHARQRNEQRRLDHEPPEPLAARVEQGEPVRLDERPDDAGEDRQRTEQRDRDNTRAARSPDGRQLCDDLFHCSSARSNGTTTPAGTGPGPRATRGTEAAATRTRGRRGAA